MAIMSGCMGRQHNFEITEKVCPNCGEIIELFSTDTEVACDNCGFVAYNDTLTCVQWCEYAEQCVGPEMYAQMMKVAELQKQKRAEERAAKAAAKAAEQA